jgi:hypothetical protein
MNGLLLRRSREARVQVFKEVGFGGGFVDGKIAWVRRFPETKGER